jgi:hypothetical protein
MKTLSLIFFIALFFSCSKTDKKSISAGSVDFAYTGSDTVNVPINDLATGTFRGYEGGLFPNGTNTPSGTYGRDLLSACKSVVPIDTFGLSSSSGSIVFISLGGSTSGHLFDSLKAKTTRSPRANPYLQLLKCSNGYGSASVNSIMNPTDPYWDFVTQVILGQHSSFRQVQVVYLESDDSSVKVNFPQRPAQLKSELQECFRTLKNKFPNIKLVYLLGRTRTFEYGTITQKRFNREPSPYYFGWAAKWAIEDQINGVPGTAYKGKNAVSPLITWGWYEWGNDTPRQDGFKWTQQDTRDGLHATPAGEDTLSTRFQNFLLTDRGASTWYAKH